MHVACNFNQNDVYLLGTASHTDYCLERLSKMRGEAAL